MRNPDRSSPRSATELPSSVVNDGWWLVAEFPIPCKPERRRSGCAFHVIAGGKANAEHDNTAIETIKHHNLGYERDSASGDAE
ncbi:hypothetical protein DevBK_17175 [Devosia sp. BK]|uniref:hypothetical protein n=1 Tax=Devosia sp. BK TaxID=2871706 RepID=UPI00293B300F|nr:hypothetical protein [Devosia sp. BK]MDV3253075.1 hypothetical protein [Devosia sp. BK]